MREGGTQGGNIGCIVVLVVIVCVFCSLCCVSWTQGGKNGRERGGESELESERG